MAAVMIVRREAAGVVRIGAMMIGRKGSAEIPSTCRAWCARRPYALRYGLPLLAFAAALLAIGPVRAAESGAGPSPVTEAEKRLFQTDHLAAVAPAKVLSYKFERRGSLEAQADDSATVTVGVREGKRVADVDFLHDDRRFDLPPTADVEGNPIVLHFLERELREMNRLTGGSRSYYRKRIRMALAADPPVTEVAIDHQGKALRGYRIRVDPYLDDPARARFERFATRFYTVVLSPDIPGEIYQLRAELLEPARDGDAPAAIHSETLTFDAQR